MKKGFTLIELLITITIIAILASLVLYSALSYVNKSKDAAVKGGLVVLIPAGEKWYDNNNGSYLDFCDDSEAIEKAQQDVPSQINCDATDTAWAACAQLFVSNQKAYCVDSKGNRKEINNSSCNSTITSCP